MRQSGSRRLTPARGSPHAFTTALLTLHTRPIIARSDVCSRGSTCTCTTSGRWLSSARRGESTWPEWCAGTWTGARGCCSWSSEVAAAAAASAGEVNVVRCDTGIVETRLETGYTNTSGRVVAAVTRGSRLGGGAGWGRFEEVRERNSGALYLVLSGGGRGGRFLFFPTSLSRRALLHYSAIIVYMHSSNLPWDAYF
jgi:hypothetical protein